MQVRFEEAESKDIVRDWPNELCSFLLGRGGIVAL